MTDSETKNTISSIELATKNILKESAENLEVIPAVALKILRLTSDDKVTQVSDLSKLIETEPILAAKILGQVNSSAFPLPEEVTSLHRAVNMLGFSAVRKIALDQLFYNKLFQPKANQQFDQLFFWQHCLFVASLGRAIADALGHDDPDLIYSAGLMHDIGKVVLESHGKVSYSDFIFASQSEEQVSIKSEHDFFGLSHADIGYVICQQWDIPERIRAVVYCHHDFPDENSEFYSHKEDIAIVSIANYIAWMHGIGSISSNSTPDLAPEVLKHVAFETLDIERLLSEVDAEMQKTGGVYGINFPSLIELRATLVQTTLFLNRQGSTTETVDALPNNISLSSLTTPHKSLIPEEIIPWTLAAIQQDFSFDRLIMLNIDLKQRCLVVANALPKSFDKEILSHFNVKVESLNRTVLQSLRERKALIINQQSEGELSILQQFQVDEFLLMPILSDNRLIALFYADNFDTKEAIKESSIKQVGPIIHELGVALTNAKKFELEKQRAELDPLTNLMNKRMVLNYLTDVFQLPVKELGKVAIGFMDIDHFKKFNDTCGHQAGDDALKIVAQIMQSLTRPQDFIGRYGGEEFVFILRDTHIKGAAIYAERIRKEIERKGKILSQRFEGHALTVSIGVSFYKPSYATYEQMIEAADMAMYASKKKGRNQVSIA
ncbi:MAG: GGDEF domain-containing protein [Methyloprofundus sp.]|nr:GGDEF domain-containing protein [Methyloprofundus sp.]